MNVVICGAGEVGRYSAEVMQRAGHNVTIIDRNTHTLAMLDELMDVHSLHGNATHAHALIEAGVRSAELFIAATNIDEINLLAASVAKAIGAGQCIARVHHSAFLDVKVHDYAKQLGLDHLVCPEDTTARAIASSLRSPGALAVDQFAHGKIEMQRLPVSRKAKAAGTQLRDLSMPKGTRVAAIERSGQAMMPGAETRIDAGDVVTLIGDAERFDKACGMFDTESTGRLRVVLLGGTSQAVWLTRALQHRNVSIRLFEQDRQRAQELAQKLDWITVQSMDLVETDGFKAESVDDADAFVALTDDDETNILAAARAKSLGTPIAMAVLQRSTYLHLVEHVGIDRAFSPRATAVAEIQRLLDRGPVRKLVSLAKGIAEVYELKLGDGATSLVGRPLRDLNLPPGTLIAAVQRGDDVFVPGANDELSLGDTLILIGNESLHKTLTRMVGG